MPDIDMTNYEALNLAINGRQIHEGSPLKKIIRMCENSSNDAALVWINGYLTEIMRKFAPDLLWEQIDPFISARGEVEKTLTELVGLACLSKAELLDDIGWPAGQAGSPPFDGTIKFNDVIIPFDIKSLCGSGYRLLERKLSTVVDDWARNNGLQYASIGIKHDGSIMPQIIGQQIPSTIADFRLQLSQFQNIPTHPIKVAIGNVIIEVQISDGIRTLSSGGISFVGQEIEAFQQTILDHAKHKGASAYQLHEDYYLLVYVLPYGFGDANVNRYAFDVATKLAVGTNIDFAGREKWIGCVMIDNVRLPGSASISYQKTHNSRFSQSDFEKSNLQIIQF